MNPEHLIQILLMQSEKAILDFKKARRFNTEIFEFRRGKLCQIIKLMEEILLMLQLDKQLHSELDGNIRKSKYFLAEITMTRLKWEDSNEFK